MASWFCASVVWLGVLQGCSSVCLPGNVQGRPVGASLRHAFCRAWGASRQFLQSLPLWDPSSVRPVLPLQPMAVLWGGELAVTL